MTRDRLSLSSSYDTQRQFQATIIKLETPTLRQPTFAPGTCSSNASSIVQSGVRSRPTPNLLLSRSSMRADDIIHCTTKSYLSDGSRISTGHRRCKPNAGRRATTVPRPKTRLSRDILVVLPRLHPAAFP
ncbi:hypothetical protein NMY22_g12170 [Coprinellus aureogranulatus]|nr:hypothetical protein NMY22_g12170 [Coprinellus aureogranulatus]